MIILTSSPRVSENRYIEVQSRFIHVESPLSYLSKNSKEKDTKRSYGLRVIGGKDQDTDFTTPKSETHTRQRSNTDVDGDSHFTVFFRLFSCWSS